MGISWDIAPIANTMVAEGYVLPWLNPLFWEATFLMASLKQIQEKSQCCIRRRKVTDQLNRLGRAETNGTC